MALLLLATTAPVAVAPGVGLPLDPLALVGLGPSAADDPAEASPTVGATSASGPTIMVAADETDLSLSKTDSADPVAVGSSFNYTLTVTNGGPARATNLVVTDALPAGVTFVSATSGCTLSGSTVTCTRNNLNSGSSVSFVITVTASTVGEWTNTASVSGSQVDPTTSNNADSETTRIRTVAPTGLTCFADPSGVHLDWSDVAQATGYNVYRRTGSSGSFVLLASSSTSDHLDSTAAVGQSYQYHVTATSAGGESAPSDACTVASVPMMGLVAGGAALVASVSAFALLRRRA